MLYHLDALTLREASPKFRAITGFVAFEKTNPDHLWELAVLMATPGFSEGDVRNLFGQRLQRRTMVVVRELGLDVAEAAQANALSITEEDALRMVLVTPRSCQLNSWARAWVMGRSEEEVVAKVGVGVEVVRKWRAAGRWRWRRPVVG